MHMTLIQTIIFRLQRFMQVFTPSLNQIVLFFLILFIGFLVGKISGRLLRKLLADLSADRYIKRVTGGKFSLERGLSGLVASLIYFASIILALNAVGLTTTVLEIILGILVLAIVISALVALKNIIPNLAEGIALRGKLTEGSYIRMDDAQGMIKEVNLLETLLETDKGDVIVIPNAFFAKKSIRIMRKPRKAKRKKPAETDKTGEKK